MPDPAPRKKSFSRLVGEYSSLAFVLPISVVVGYGIGYGLDRLFGTNFWYIVWLLIGIAAGMRDLIRKVDNLQKDLDQGGGGE